MGTAVHPKNDMLYSMYDWLPLYYCYRRYCRHWRPLLPATSSITCRATVGGREEKFSRVRMQAGGLPLTLPAGIIYLSSIGSKTWHLTRVELLSVTITTYQGHTNTHPTMQSPPDGYRIGPAR